MEKPQKGRQLWADVAKGIAILLVAINHCGNGILVREPLPDGSRGWDFFTGFSYSFMVPVFFFISGWFDEKRLKPPGQRVKAIATGLLYPCALWMMLQATILHFLRKESIPLWKSLYYFVIYDPMQFWFFRALFGLLLLSMLWRAIRLPALARVLLAVGMYALYRQNLFSNVVNDILKSALFFELGVGLAGFSKAPGWLENRAVAAALGGLALTGCAMLFPAGGWLYLAASLLGVAGVLLISTAVRLPWGEPLAMLGRASLAIYCAHLFFSSGFRPLHGPLGISSFGWQLTIGSFLGVAGPLVLAWLDRCWGGWIFRFPTTEQVERVATSANLPQAPLHQ